MRAKYWVSTVAGMILIIATTGCSVRDMAASGMVSFGNEYMSPWFMASNDTDVMCAMGEGMVRNLKKNDFEDSLVFLGSRTINCQAPPGFWRPLWHFVNCQEVPRNFKKLQETSGTTSILLA